ncbi:CHRD domain-containing protein [Lysobacter sp. BMK333-48F3]|uniref:CHRD domain-containing protein n=1 Tax=Lysobacter sp. BMK333-48F3 TaxID=2867962 RepID=UPI001C8B23B4|nr:CHRD domain-containing protein [Lysobacter sp. BMK333-48F3]MBX9403298.1 CHRD domain-containing protein [Lysobacter sp. BMK333-48F3]
MKRIALSALIATFALVPAQAEHREFRAVLEGSQEIPLVSTAGGGGFRARLDGGAIHYELSYAGLEGDVTQAHIHVGQRGVNGGVAVWLCSNLASPPTPAGVQPCPAAPARITGTILPADVVGPAGQGIAAGEFEELVRALRDGNAYANVHTSKFPGGEVRSQLGDPRED